MKAVPFAAVTSSSWDALCSASRQSWLFHRTDWVDIETRFFAAQNLSFALQEGPDIAAVQPLYLNECGLGAWSERLVHSGIHRHTGLALADGLGASEARAARNAAMRRILEIAGELDADRIQLNVHNLAPESLTTARQEIPFWVEDHGFQLGLNFGPQGMVPAPGLATCCADQLVSLAGEEGDLFGALDESCRRAVRKAKASGVEFEAGSGDGCIADYYSLAKLAAKRTGESLPPAAYYEEIWRRFSTSGECTVLFARRESRRVAAQMLIVCKSAANFLAGVSDPEYLPMRVNDFLHWSAMLWARKAGCTVYRLGPAFPGLPADWPIARVSRFKTKFGGRAATVIQGSLFRHPHKYRAGGESHVAALCNVGTEAGALQEQD